MFYAKRWNQERSEYNTITSSTMIQVPTVDCHPKCTKSDHRYQAPGMTAALPLALVLFQYQSAISEKTNRRLKHSLTGVIGVTVVQCNL